jgi:hypothetical protein
MNLGKLGPIRRAVIGIVLMCGLVHSGSARAESAVARCIDKKVAQVGRHGRMHDYDPIDSHTLIVDSNVAYSLRKTKASRNAAHEATRAKIGKILHGGKYYDIRVTKATRIENQLHPEWGEVPYPTFPLADVPQSEFEAVWAELKSANVGGGKGDADRTQLAQAFCARVAEGEPAFATADRGIYNRLYRIAFGKDPVTLGRPVYDVFPDGFDVTIRGHHLWVFPIPPQAH